MIAARTQLGQFDIVTAVKSAYTTGKTIYDATKSGSQAGITATNTADAYAQRLYTACSKLTVPLARSQCMARVTRELALRAVGKQQATMGPVNIPASNATGAIVTVGVVAAIGAAIWFLL